MAAIVEKDLRVTRWAWPAAIATAAIGFVMMWGAASSTRIYQFQYPYMVFAWNDSLLRGIYAGAAGLTSFVLGLSFASVYGGEVRKGTIRSIMLYPVDMNDVTLAKLGSSFLLTFGVSMILWLGMFGAFFLNGVFPAADFLGILLMAILMSFLTLATGVFLAQGLAYLTGRMALSPVALGSLFLFFALFFTQTVLNGIGVQLLYLSAAGRGTPPTLEEIWAVDDLARGISVVSPHHIGARLLSILFGLTTMWSDVHVVVPVAVVILVAGYVFGRKVYLDIFIR